MTKTQKSKIIAREAHKGMIMTVSVMTAQELDSMLQNRAAFFHGETIKVNALPLR